MNWGEAMEVEEVREMAADLSLGGAPAMGGLLAGFDGLAQGFYPEDAGQPALVGQDDFMSSVAVQPMAQAAPTQPLDHQVAEPLASVGDIETFIHRAVREFQDMDGAPPEDFFSAYLGDAPVDVDSLYANLPDEGEDDSDQARLARLFSATPMLEVVLKTTLPEGRADVVRHFRDGLRCAAAALAQRHARGKDIPAHWAPWLNALNEEWDWLGLSPGKLSESERARLAVDGEAKLVFLEAAEGSHFGRLWGPLREWEGALGRFSDIVNQRRFDQTGEKGGECVAALRVLLGVWEETVVAEVDDPLDAVFYDEQKPAQRAALEDFRELGVRALPRAVADLRRLADDAAYFGAPAAEELGAQTDVLERRVFQGLVKVRGTSWVLEKRSPSKAKSEMKERRTMRNPFRPTAELVGLEALGLETKTAEVEVLVVTEDQAARITAGRPVHEVVDKRSKGAGGVVVNLASDKMHFESHGDGMWLASLANPHHSICFYEDIFHAEGRPGIRHVAQNVSRLVFVFSFYRTNGEKVHFAKVSPCPVFVTSHAKEWMFKSLPLLLFMLSAGPGGLGVGAALPASVPHSAFEASVAELVRAVATRKAGAGTLVPRASLGGHLERGLGRRADDKRDVQLASLLGDERHQCWKDLYLHAETLGKRGKKRSAAGEC